MTIFSMVYSLPITSWKINMEPTNHPFRKENYLPNLQGIMFHVNLQGCTIKINHAMDRWIYQAHGSGIEKILKCLGWKTQRSILGFQKNPAFSGFYTPWNQHFRTWKWMVGKLCSFWDGIFFQVLLLLVWGILVDLIFDSHIQKHLGYQQWWAFRKYFSPGVQCPSIRPAWPECFGPLEKKHQIAGVPCWKQFFHPPKNAI